jgi:hypothetical protein
MLAIEDYPGGNLRISICDLDGRYWYPEKLEVAYSARIDIPIIWGIESWVCQSK